MAVSISDVLKKVPGAVKKISGKPLGIASKVMGAAAIASVVYDAHVNAAEKADTYDSVKTADKMHNDYKRYITSNKKSATLAKLKRYWYDMQQNTLGFHFINKTAGYTGEFVSTAVSNAPKLLLAGAALAFKKAGKIAGIVLLLDAVRTFIFDVAGLGAKKEKI